MGISELDFELKVVECPYMPEGFVALADRTGWVVCNTKTGDTFRIPFHSLIPGPYHITETKRDWDKD
jgi:hypothetical protein